LKVSPKIFEISVALLRRHKSGRFTPVIITFLAGLGNFKDFIFIVIKAKLSAAFFPKAVLISKPAMFATRRLKYFSGWLRGVIFCCLFAF
jgi:hypothetical protein